MNSPGQSTWCKMKLSLKNLPALRLAVAVPPLLLCWTLIKKKNKLMMCSFHTFFFRTRISIVFVFSQPWWLQISFFCLNGENILSFVFFVSVSEKTKMDFASWKFSCFFSKAKPGGPLRAWAARLGFRKKKLIFKNKAHFLFFSETDTKKTKEPFYSPFFRQKNSENYLTRTNIIFRSHKSFQKIKHQETLTK